MLSVAAYILSIAGINWAFALVGANFITNSIAGLVFILRDRAQVAIGHYVWIAMAVAIGISYELAAPEIALASAIAFALSEAVDWFVYTFTERPWHERMLWSSLFAAPVDSVFFLWIAGFLDWTSVITMTLAKWSAAAALWLIVRERCRRPA